MGELVQLPQDDLDPRGNRYTEEDRAAWYLLWRTTAGRSCRKVALRFDVDERTIRAARDAGDWVNRANLEDTDDYASSRHGVAALVVTELVPSIEKMRDLRDHAKDEKVQADAAKWLAGLAGVSPVSKIEQAVIQAPKQAEVIDVPALTGMSPDELMRLEQQAREGSR